MGLRKIAPIVKRKRKINVSLALTNLGRRWRIKNTDKMALKSYTDFKNKKKKKRRLSGDFITGAVTGIVGTALVVETANIINS